MSEFEDRVNSILNDPDQMDKIANLAKTLIGGDGAPDDGAPDDGAPPTDEKKGGLAALFDGAGADAAVLGRISRALSTQSAADRDKTALLEAMKPYLSEKRRNKMDKAMKIAKFARIARAAMGESGGEEDV